MCSILFGTPIKDGIYLQEFYINIYEAVFLAIGLFLSSTAYEQTFYFSQDSASIGIELYPSPKDSSLIISIWLKNNYSKPIYLPFTERWEPKAFVSTDTAEFYIYVGNVVPSYPTFLEGGSILLYKVGKGDTLSAKAIGHFSKMESYNKFVSLHSKDLKQNMGFHWDYFIGNSDLLPNACTYCSTDPTTYSNNSRYLSITIPKSILSK